MSTTILIPASLRDAAAGARELRVDAPTVGDALALLAGQFPQLGRHLYDERGTLRGFVNVNVNDEDARALGGDRAPLRAGDTLVIVPSIAGGAAALEPEETLRYARHLLMPDVGAAGQRRLGAARVAVVGAGGLGCPVALYLAAAGVGTLRLVDDDVVDVTNLQRQVLYAGGDVGRRKVDVAAARLRALDPHVRVDPRATRLAPANAAELLRGHDVVVDATDNFAARYAVSAACVRLGIPHVFAAILRFEGQVSVFDAARGPCYRCAFREPPPPALAPSCAESGVLGALPGAIGSLQALEALELLLGIGEPLVGRLLLVDGLSLRVRELRVRKDPHCPACGVGAADAAADVTTAACAAAPPEVREISAAELHARLARGDPLRLVDVREPHEWEIANLARWGASLVPLSQLAERLSELDRSQEIVLHCREGGRSARAYRQLRDAGFERLWSLAGGLGAWAREVDAAGPRYRAAPPGAGGPSGHSPVNAVAASTKQTGLPNGSSA